MTRRRDPIHLTCDPALAQQRRDAHADAITARDRAAAELWATWRAERTARAQQDRAWTNLP